MISPLRGAIFALIALSASCASFTPNLFDAAEHRARWGERHLAFPGVAEFARGLAEASPQAGPFDPADGISLAEAELIGLVLNGGLRSSRARLKISEADAEHARLWADPQVNLSVQRVLGLATEPWVVAADLALSIPLSGSPWLEKGRAEARHDSAVWRTVGEEWSFIHKLRLAWIDWSAFETKAAVARRQLQAVEQVQSVLQQLGDAGEIPRTDVRLFSIERTTLDIQVHHNTHEAEEQSMRVRLLLGLHPGAGLKLLPSIPPPESPDADDASGLDTGFVESHPAMRAAKAGLEESEQALRIAIRASWPSPQAGPSYERDQGIDKAGGAASFTLPLWNRNRRAIAEAEAAREAAWVACETEAERLAGEYALARHHLEASLGDIRLLEGELAPLADEQLREARALAELGELQSLLLLEALQKSYETKIAIIEARRESSRATADLLHLRASGVPTMLKETRHDDAK